MKQIFFGIALILFALVLLLSEIWLPIVGDLMSRGEFAVLIAVIGLVIAGIGAFKEKYRSMAAVSAADCKIDFPVRRNLQWLKK